MSVVDRRIVRFVLRHHVLTLATVTDSQPWCASIFYVYDPVRNAFVYASDPQTRHAREAEENPAVGASIVLETKIVRRIKGVQITGHTRPVTENDCWAKTEYLKRFPFAAALKLDLWILQPNYIKFTDNTLGFGYKLVWEL